MESLDLFAVTTLYEPASSVILLFESVIESLLFTVTLHTALTTPVESLTVISAEPTVTAVTFPLTATVATLVFDDLNLILLLSVLTVALILFHF